MAILLRGLEALSPDSSAHILLKFFEEFVHNRNQRLNLDISSPNGILIFRNASQVLNSYGNKQRKSQTCLHLNWLIIFSFLSRSTCDWTPN
jgi:exportin-7